MPVYEKPSRAKRPRRDEKRWQVVVEHQGRRMEFVFYGSKREAEDFEAAERLKLKAKDPGALRGVPRFSDFCATHYRPHAELKLKKGTWYRATFMVATLGAHLGDKRLDEIGLGDVEAYQRARLADGLKAISVNNECRILRRILNYGRQRGLPVTGDVVEMLEEAEHRVQVWTDEQVKALLDACADDSPEIVPLVMCLLNTGCRKGEAIALKWECVDLKRRFIHIWPNDEWQPKNGKPREVPIPRALLPFLKGPRKSDVWVFPSRTGERYTFWPKLQFDRVRKKAGLTGGPHTGRHTFASHFLKRRPDLFLLARVMGHGDVTVTRRYAHLLPDHLDRAREAVNFESPMSPGTLRKRAEEKLSKHASRAGSAQRRSSRTVSPSRTPEPTPVAGGARQVTADSLSDSLSEMKRGCVGDATP